MFHVSKRKSFQLLYDFLIGGEPIDGVELVFAEPSRCLMLFQGERATLDATPEAMHLEEKFGILPLYCLDEALDDNTGFELFPYLALEGFFRRFAWFHLAAWKLPAILIIAIASLSGEDTPLGVVYDCCYYFYHYGAKIVFFTQTTNIIAENSRKTCSIGSLPDA